MLLSIPAELVVKLIPSCTIPEVFVASYVFGEGNEVQLEYKEKEIEKGVLMLKKQMLKERPMSGEELCALRSVLVECCGEPVAKKCLMLVEERTRQESVEDGYFQFEVSKRIGTIGVCSVCSSSTFTLQLKANWAFFITYSKSIELFSSTPNPLKPIRRFRFPLFSI